MLCYIIITAALRLTARFRKFYLAVKVDLTGHLTEMWLIVFLQHLTDRQLDFIGRQRSVN